MNLYVRHAEYGKIRPLRTHPERRAVRAAELEGIRPRAKRGLRCLPTAWEDKMLRRQKSWKWLGKARKRVKGNP